MTAAYYAPEGLVSAGILVAPIILGVAALRVPSRFGWAAPVLAAPALLIGVAFTWALIRDGAGYGGVVSLLYGPVLVMLGALAMLRWYMHRGEAA